MSKVGYKLNSEDEKTEAEYNKKLNDLGDIPINQKHEIILRRQYDELQEKYINKAIRTMKVSVICPTYNRLSFLKRAIDSFLKQDYENSEMIILMNGCTDETNWYLTKEFTHPRITVIRRTVNTPIGSLNELWSHATGDLICQLHDDDFLTENSLSLRVEKFIENPKLEMIYGGANQVNPNGDNLKFCPGEIPDKNRILKNDYINFTTLMWRKEIPFKFDDDFEFNLDWMFKIRCLHELNCGYVYSSVMNYTIHAGQETHRSRVSGAHDREILMLKEKVKTLYDI